MPATTNRETKCFYSGRHEWIWEYHFADFTWMKQASLITGCVCHNYTCVTSLMWSSIETSQAMVLETCHTEQNNWVVMTSSLSSSVMREMFTFTRANTKITGTFISCVRWSRHSKGIHKIGLFRGPLINTSDWIVMSQLCCFTYYESILKTNTLSVLPVPARFGALSRSVYHFLKLMITIRFLFVAELLRFFIKLKKL